VPPAAGPRSACWAARRCDPRAVPARTDAGDSLSWNREAQHGWGVGLYRSGSEGDDGPERFEEDEDSTSTDTLLRLVQEVLHPSGQAS